MIKTVITPQEVCDVLNAAAALDPQAILALVEARVPCNEHLAAHPTIQVGMDEDENYRVGLLGILNGILGTNGNGWGVLVAEYPDAGEQQTEYPIRFAIDPKYGNQPVANVPQALLPGYHSCTPQDHAPGDCAVCDEAATK